MPLMKRMGYLISGIRGAVSGRISGDLKRSELSQAFQVAKRYYHGKYRGYAAAETGRLRGDWTTVNENQTATLAKSIKTLISRSHDAYNNNVYARAIIKIFCSNVVSQGIKPTPRVKDKNGNDETRINQAIKDFWSRANDEMDRVHGFTFYENENTALKSIMLTGGVFGSWYGNKDTAKMPYALQIMDQSCLDFTGDTYQYFTEKEKCNPSKKTVYGIEYNNFGEPVKYNFGGLYQKDIRMAGDIIHAFRQDLAGQLIGVPWLTPGLPALYDIDQLVESVVVSARIAAAIGLWVKPGEDDDYPVDHEGDEKISGEDIVIAPGEIYRTTNEPKVISATNQVEKVVEPLIRIILHGVAVSQGISYQLLSKDLTNSNYSASRANSMEDRREFTAVRRFFVKQWCQKVYEKVVESAVFIGEIPGVTATNLSKDRWHLMQANWSSDAFQYINPKDEVEANALMLSQKMMTDQMYYAEKGLDYKEVYAQLAKEKQERDALGIESPQKSENKPKGEEKEESDG